MYVLCAMIVRSLFSFAALKLHRQEVDRRSKRLSEPQQHLVSGDHSHAQPLQTRSYVLGTHSPGSGGRQHLIDP